MVVKEVLIVPIILSLTIGVGLQLADLATETSDKTVAFATSANNAVDCAFKGVSLDECSPNLTNYDFKPEMHRLQRISEQYNMTLENGQEFSVYYDNKEVNFKVKSVNDSLVLVKTGRKVSTSSEGGITGNFMGTSSEIKFKPYLNKFLDLNNDGVYDISVKTKKNVMQASLSNRPTIRYFLDSGYNVAALLLLGLYMLLTINKRYSKDE